jgi:hypothetical protein
MDKKATTAAYVVGYLTVVGMTTLTSDIRLLIAPLGVLGTYGLASLMSDWLTTE